MSGFKVSIVGLGLMGGSLAYALRGFKECKITGYDINPDTVDAALGAGAIDRSAASLKKCVHDADLTIFCSSPDTIVENIRACLDAFKPGSTVTEICGVKRDILAFAESHMPEYVNYVGLHPMAGKEVGGFVNADKRIFHRAGFLLVVTERSHPRSVELLRELSEYVGAGRVVVNHAGEHDKLIAYTSDLMHITATAICHDYPTNMTMAHTAGAFRDCTRVATIDADLWTDLLTKNAENIIPFLDRYIENLSAFKRALSDGDTGFMREFLNAASDNKRNILKL